MKLRNREVTYHRVISKRRRRRRHDVPLELQREIFKHADMHLFCRSDAGLRKYMIDNRFLSQRSLRFALLWSTSKKIKCTTAHLIENGVQPTTEAMMLYAQHKKEQLDLSNVAQEDRQQAVERALKAGDVDRVRRLYQPGMSVTCCLDECDKGTHCIQRLCREDNLEDLSFLVENKLISSLPGVMYFAVVYGAIKLLHYLYQQGASCNLFYRNMSARAAATGNFALVQLYLTKEAVAFPPSSLIEVYEDYSADKKEGILQIVKWAYATIEINDSITEALLKEASRKGHTEAVGYLLNNHMRRITLREDSECLVNAITNEHLDIYDLLCQHLDQPSDHI